MRQQIKIGNSKGVCYFKHHGLCTPYTYIFICDDSFLNKSTYSSLIHLYIYLYGRSDYISNQCAFICIINEQATRATQYNYVIKVSSKSILTFFCPSTNFTPREKMQEYISHSVTADRQNEKLVSQLCTRRRERVVFFFTKIDKYDQGPNNVGILPDLISLHDYDCNLVGVLTPVSHIPRITFDVSNNY